MVQRKSFIPKVAKSQSDTIDAYRRHADRFETRGSQKNTDAASPFLTAALARLPRCAKVLDFGCGSGHDALLFLRAGHRVIGIDATDVLIERARVRCQRFPKARFRIGTMQTASLGSDYDLIWANASLIHLPKNDLPATLRRILAALKPGGVLAATIHNGRREGVSQRTWIPGRFFASYLKEELGHYVKSSGLVIHELRGVVNQDRKGRWLNLVAERHLR